MKVQDETTKTPFQVVIRFLLLAMTSGFNCFNEFSVIWKIS